MDLDFNFSNKSNCNMIAKREFEHDNISNILLFSNIDMFYCLRGCASYSC